MSETPMNRTAMIIAANPSTRRTLTQALGRHGCRVVEADGPAVARRQAEIEAVDIAVLDLSSLAEDGLLLIPALRRVRPGIRIILLTGSEQIALSIRGMRLGADDDLPMPLDVEQLASRVDAALDVSNDTGRDDATRPQSGPRRAE